MEVFLRNLKRETTAKPWESWVRNGSPVFAPLLFRPNTPPHAVGASSNPDGPKPFPSHLRKVFDIELNDRCFSGESGWVSATRCPDAKNQCNARATEKYNKIRPFTVHWPPCWGIFPHHRRSFPHQGAEKTSGPSPTSVPNAFPVHRPQSPSGRRGRIQISTVKG